jgi:glycosyltransferase involved in cell wall biosynthesis
MLRHLVWDGVGRRKRWGAAGLWLTGNPVVCYLYAIPEFIWGTTAKMSRGLLEGRMNISAIIPLYNGGKYIRAALDSVLRQDRPADEIIVVDDGSTDDGASDSSLKWPQVYPAIKLVSKPNGGQSSARNFGVRHSKGDLIALLDQDDEWYPHHLRILEQPFKETRSIPLGWAYSNLDHIDVLGRMMTRSVLDTVPNSLHPKRDVLNCLGPRYVSFCRGPRLSLVPPSIP